MDATDGIGRLYQADGTIFFRGGGATRGAGTGVFALILARASANQDNGVGFRCVE